MDQDMFGTPWTPDSDQESDDNVMDEEDPDLDTNIEADSRGILMLPVQFKEAFMGIQVLDPKSPLAAYDVDLCLVIIKRHYGYTDYQAQEHFKETIGEGLLRVPRAPIFIHRFIADWDVIAREEADDTN